MQNQLIALVGKAFANQNELNNKLTPEWATRGWPYYRAVWTEIAEAVGHLNWLWWKQGTFGQPLSDTQRTDLHIELCDVLHFGISLDIIRWAGERSWSDLAKEYVDAFAAAATSEDLAESLEGVVVDAILLRAFNVKKFARACYAAGLDLPGLLSFYFGKTTLNKFRWDHGYNLPKGHPDAYVKMWEFSGSKAVEDNVVLGEIIAGMRAKNTVDDIVTGLETGELTESLYAQLGGKYEKILRK